LCDLALSCRKRCPVEVRDEALNGELSSVEWRSSSKHSRSPAEPFDGFSERPPKSIVSAEKAKKDALQARRRCSIVAREHGLDVWEVRQRYEEYKKWDLDGNGELSQEEFLVGVCRHCNLPKDEPIPDHLRAQTWCMADVNKDGVVDFEEYVVWLNAHQWDEEFAVTDPKERELRRLARHYGFHLLDVEKVKRIFDKFDAHNTGHISKDDLGSIIRWILKLSPEDLSAKDLTPYLLGVKHATFGLISFEEFVVWYFTVFSKITGA